jgi:hypothetical protein
VNLGDAVNSEHDEAWATFGPDGKSIFFASKRPKPIEAVADAVRDQPASAEGVEADEADWDLYWSPVVLEGVISSQTLPIFGEAQYLHHVNTEANELHAAMPNGSDLLYFASDRRGGLGGYDIWVSRFFGGAYIEPENLGKPVNSPLDEFFPTFSARGAQMFYVSNVYSIHPQMLKFYSTQSRQVLSRFDYDLLKKVLLIVLLLVIAGLAIHYLLKLLLDSELKLLPRCLIASFLLHLILAALSGSLFLSSKIEETFETNLQQMTVNLNALAQESISVAIRESIASLPQVQAPSTMQQMEVSVPLQTETPVQHRVNPMPETVAVRQTSVATERVTQVQQAQPTMPSSSSTAAKVASLSFSSSSLMMESPQGIVQSGDGDQMDPSDNQPPRPEPQEEPRRVADTAMQAPSYDPFDATRAEIADVITQTVQAGSVAIASRAQASGNLAQQVVKGINAANAEDRPVPLAPGSPTSVAFDQAYGSLVFKADFVMEVVSETEEEEDEDFFQRFRGGATGRIADTRSFGFDRAFVDQRIPSSMGERGDRVEFDRHRITRQRETERSLTGVSGLLKSSMPGLTMQVDNELEIPEHMLEAVERERVRPSF